MEILNKAFYALQDSKTPMIISGIAILLNVTLSVILVNVMGYLGLPLAASITSILTAVIMLWRINSKIEKIVDCGTFKELLKCLISAVIMCMILQVLRTVVGIPQIIKIILSVLVGVIVYIGMAIILKSEITIEAVNMLKRKIKK